VSRQLRATGRAIALAYPQEQLSTATLPGVGENGELQPPSAPSTTRSAADAANNKSTGGGGTLVDPQGAGGRRYHARRHSDGLAKNLIPHPPPAAPPGDRLGPSHTGNAASRGGGVGEPTKPRGGRRPTPFLTPLARRKPPQPKLKEDEEPRPSAAATEEVTLSQPPPPAAAQASAGTNRRDDHSTRRQRGGGGSSSSSLSSSSSAAAALTLRAQPKREVVLTGRPYVGGRRGVDSLAGQDWPALRIGAAPKLDAQSSPRRRSEGQLLSLPALACTELPSTPSNIHITVGTPRMYARGGSPPSAGPPAALSHREVGGGDVLAAAGSEEPPQIPIGTPRGGLRVSAGQ
jgi:hypothetical protein